MTALKSRAYDHPCTFNGAATTWVVFARKYRSRFQFMSIDLYLLFYTGARAIRFHQANETAYFSAFCVKVGAWVLAVGERKNSRKLTKSTLVSDDAKSTTRRNEIACPTWMKFCKTVAISDWTPTQITVTIGETGGRGLEVVGVSNFTLLQLMLIVILDVRLEGKSM